ncbi:MAG: hypothetical protein LBM17_02625 [Candidatus Accumulibacter sp.]|nr:hypothetical protein [Accumulibacter sp.]
MAALTFQEAIDFYKGKLKLPSGGWTDIWQEQHSHGFVVAGASTDSLVEDLYNAIFTASQKGGFKEFQKDFPNVVAKHGWAHNGSPEWRSRVIYDTNVLQAQNAGRYKQAMEMLVYRPFWQYVHTTQDNPRKEHEAWDGLILPGNDPWWDTHYPQNGWHCRCRVDTLTRREAKRAWEAKGNTGPDTAPPIEWEKKVVGKKTSMPREVLVPKGIDPGFAYNPGKAWLEPHTVPPLDGYEAVLKERGATWPTGFTPPPAPMPTQYPASVLLPATTPPVVAVESFLGHFNASLAKGSVFTDVAGSSLAITHALFVKGKNKQGTNFKWLSNPAKLDRLRYVNVLAETLKIPDEIWWAWEQSRDNPDKWLLRRRYLKAFEIAGSNQYGIGVFEWEKYGWRGATTFLPSDADEVVRLEYFNKQRTGRLVYRK